MLAPARKILATRLFKRSEEPWSAGHAIIWWEMRRGVFNLVVGVAGAFTWLLLGVLGEIYSHWLDSPLGLGDEPVFTLFVVLAYGIGANVCYTVGWIGELIIQRLWPDRAGAYAEMSFTLGLMFSVLLTLSPAALLLGVFVLQRILG